MESEKVKRKTITNFLGNVLEERLLKEKGTHYAKEVSINFGTAEARRIDYVSFVPEHQLSVSGIEHGNFTCYEVKSCKADIYSGSGLNFVGDKNYLVITYDCFKQIEQDIKDGTLKEYIKQNYPESSVIYGVIVVHKKGAKEEKIKSGSRIDEWDVDFVVRCRKSYRKKSATELLFSMLRAKGG